MNPSHSPEHGDTLKLGPPATGEVVIAVDPSASTAAFAAGTQTLRPGAAIPVQRHLDRDVALFIHKGQGRAILNGRSTIVLPGAMVYAPRGAWHGVRNTGTGDLQIIWVSSPGVEVFFRDLSRAGASPSAENLQTLAQRHRIEFSPAAEAPPQAGRRRRGRRGEHRHRVGSPPTRPDSSGSAVMPPPPRPEVSSPTLVAPGVSPAPSTLPHAPAASRPPRRHRRRRGGAGQRPKPPATPQELRNKVGGAPSVQPTTSTSGSARPGASRQRPPRGRHQRRGKEVYINGKWVRVEGEGPVIAPGSSWPKRRGPKPGGDDEPPGIRLSVPL